MLLMWSFACIFTETWLKQFHLCTSLLAYSFAATKCHYPRDVNKDILSIESE